MLNSLPETGSLSADTEVDSQMPDVATAQTSGFYYQNEDDAEAMLEASEAPRYLLAKTFFDCREYDRCAAVFLPLTLPRGSIADRSLEKGKSNVDSQKLSDASRGYPGTSQKALFLSLYAKYMAKICP